MILKTILKLTLGMTLEMATRMIDNFVEASPILHTLLGNLADSLLLHSGYAWSVSSI